MFAVVSLFSSTTSIRKQVGATALRPLRPTLYIAEKVSAPLWALGLPASHGSLRANCHGCWNPFINVQTSDSSAFSSSPDGAAAVISRASTLHLYNGLQSLCLWSVKQWKVRHARCLMQCVPLSRPPPGHCCHYRSSWLCWEPVLSALLDTSSTPCAPSSCLRGLHITGPWP